MLLPNLEMQTRAKRDGEGSPAVTFRARLHLQVREQHFTTPAKR